MNLPPTGTDRIGFYCPTARDVYRRRGEKPWKPNPPKRSVSLMKSDVAVAPPVDGRRNQSWRRPRGGFDGVPPGCVSVVPIDTTTRRQQRTENDPQGTSSNERVRSTRDLPFAHLYADHEHGFNGRQNLNLRGKSPSRDRWALSTGSNLEPYLYEDDFYRVNSKNSNKKLDAGGIAKTRQRASFLLCSSRKSIKTCPPDDLRPFQKTTNRSETPTHRANGTNLPQIKPNRMISSANSDTDFEKQSTGHATMMNQRQFMPSRLMSSRVPVGNNVEKPSLLATPSDHSNFFPSVATLRRQHTTFWAGPGTGRARPVSTPQLVGPVPTTQIPGPIATLRHPRDPARDLDTCRPSSAVDSPRRGFMEDLNEVSGPCSIRFVSETSSEKKPKYPRYEIPILQTASSERKTEGTSGGSLGDGKAGNQPQEILSNLRQKAFSVSMMSDSHEARFYPSNSQSFANAGNGIPVKAQNLPFDSFELSNNSQSFPFGNQDGSSLRSSSTSDWFSARGDCTSSSICVESINSDPVNSECDSDRRSTTWISKVKKVFDSVWAMLMPASTAKKQLSADTDALSDVDSGCNVEADQDLFALQRSPSENSELQKLAALVDKIAKDRKNRKEPFDVSFGRYPSDVSFHEPSYFLVSSGSRAGSPRDLECISEVAEESLHQQNSHHRSSVREDPLVAVGQNNASSLLVENSWRNSNSSSCAMPFDASHKSLPGNGAWCVSNAPFAESSKVYKDCGKSERVNIEILKIGCKDILDDRKCAFDEKSGNAAVKMPSNARKYWSVKSGLSLNEDEKSNCSKDIHVSTAFGRDQCLMHEQLSLLTEFSVSPELDKAIEMLTVTSDSIQHPNQGLSLFQTSFKDKSRAEAKHILQNDLHKPCNPCSPSVCNDTDDIRREGVMNSISTKKHIAFSKNIQHGSSVPASPKNSTAENPCSLTTDGGVTIKVFPATNPTSMENYTKELKSSGENATSPTKQNLTTLSKTNLQNCGSLKPQTKVTNSNSVLESDQNKGIALRNVQNQSKYFSKPLSSEPKCNQFTGASVSHFHNSTSTSPNSQISNCLVQHSPAVGNRICNGLPSPTVQRTRASKIAFLARQ